ncbi:hypothetical protein BBO99_00008026 [Phytophthora kernoviae]|uniref:N-acetyltransferase domain-containing protein n=1 Tax=Phytophthora kernoviae TaxID=325452 RepID=A0A3R7KG88_9STRA|nr:hypothetical protein BBI17_007884 [Phytophthora kernoviae]RLN75840.1 hypothetical protein BBO99_00008026 [Phytophthora kernoviae]
MKIVLRQFRRDDLEQVIQLFKAGMLNYPAQQQDPRLHDYIAESISTDLSDVEGTYITPGGNFWVATPRDEPTLIVGMAGLEAKPNNEGELRRMSVKCKKTIVSLTLQFASSCSCRSPVSPKDALALFMALPSVSTTVGWEFTQLFNLFTSPSNDEAVHALDNAAGENAWAMLAQTLYRLKMLLPYKMERVSGPLVNRGEENTSETCLDCGGLKHDLGGSTVYRCKPYGEVLDVNAAKHVFIKNVEKVFLAKSSIGDAFTEWSPVSSAGVIDLPQVVEIFKTGMRSYAMHEIHPEQMEAYFDESVNGDLGDIPGTYITPGGNFWVATPKTEPNTVVGFVGLEAKENKEAELRRMSVKDGYRRYGVGRKLITTLEQWAQTAGFQKVWLTTGGVMDKARAFYTSVGYQQTAVIVISEDPYFEAIKFEKIVGSSDENVPVIPADNSTELEIRQFQPGDLEQIVKLLRDGMPRFPAHKMNANLLEEYMTEAVTTGDLSSIDKSYIASGGNFWVATPRNDATEIIGMVALEAKGDGVGELRRLSVKDSYRRLGVGRQLITVLEGWAKKQGYQTVWLVTGAKIDEARAFYTSMGYTKTKAIVINEEPRVEGVLFEKMLNGASFT